MSDGAGAFSVFQFFGNDEYEEVATHVGAEEAMRRVVALVHSVDGKVGTIARVSAKPRSGLRDITDREGYTTFDWRYGQGVVFPTEAECAASRRGRQA